MRLAIAIAAVVALAAASSVAPAAAKPKKKTVRAVESARMAPGMCRPMCTFDVAPCDPPEFKRADGRCTSPVIGGTQP